MNAAFGEVIRACAKPAPGRTTTWINREIIGLYTTLHLRGHAHSVEVWDNHQLVGGLYGVSLGSAFFGESMFSLVYLVALLRACGFTLLDTQFQTDHLAQFGTLEITRANYQHHLAQAMEKRPKLALPNGVNWDHLAASFLQPVTQRS